MHGNQASLHLPLVYRGIYGDVGPFEQRSRLPEPMENGSDASLISHHEVPDAGETATALITFPEISEESDVSIVYPEIVDESDVTVVYPDIGDDSEMTITSPTIGRDDSFFQTPTYYRHVYISNSSVGYVEDVRESSVLTSESRKLLFPRQMSDIHSPDGVPESSTEARFRTWDESVVNGSNPWNESAVQFTPTRTLLSASRPNYEAENSHLVGPIDENLNRHLNRHRHRRRTSVLSSRPSFMYHRLSVQPVTPVRSSRHNHRRSQIVGLPKTRQRSSTAIERGKAKKEGVNEASQQDS